MIKVSVMYPNTKDIKFDVDYYQNTHLPMIAKMVGPALKGMELDLGIGGRESGELAPYVAIAHLKFEDRNAFKDSFLSHAKLFAADIKNYSNVKGIMQISDLVTF
ncbi:EthD family reductase [Putridiphycobacter roseus]|uniref:EthD family reductase n=2 Tax=Putridiphycobacter roseus TaxID=2219161 RepID=A0A2W1NHD3_9FLAO|nr:EthD family reductase [Putridiphycobacter roseus]